MRHVVAEKCSSILKIQKICVTLVYFSKQLMSSLFLHVSYDALIAATGVDNVLQCVGGSLHLAREAACGGRMVVVRVSRRT